MGGVPTICSFSCCNKLKPFTYLRVQEGMVDLVPIGPYGIFMATDCFTLEVYYFTSMTVDERGLRHVATITDGWDVLEEDDTEEYSQTLYACPDRKLEITYLVIPNAIETDVDVRLKLKDIGSRSRDVYGKIKASVIDFGNKCLPFHS